MTTTDPSHLWQRNIELKARCPDPAHVRRVLEQIGAARNDVLEQRDTFFQVPQGRLKLRQSTGTVAELIFYNRPDRAGARQSDYIRSEVEHPDEMRQVLSAALGLKGEVRKRREVYLWHTVRIHLDEVDGLGDFIEIESIVAIKGEEQAAQNRIDELMRALGIDPGATVPGSYADLKKM